MCNFERPRNIAPMPSIGEIAMLINGLNEFAKLFEPEPKTKENLAIDVLIALKQGHITNAKAMQLIKQILEDDTLKSASPRTVDLPKLNGTRQSASTNDLIEFISRLGV